MAAVSQYGHALRHATAELRGDADVIMTALANCKGQPLVALKGEFASLAGSAIRFSIGMSMTWMMSLKSAQTCWDLSVACFCANM